MWMNLKFIIQSEICQKEKKYHMLILNIWLLEKMVLVNQFAGQE